MEILNPNYSNILTRQLTKDEAANILNGLFGFVLEEVEEEDGGGFIIYDSEGDEFHGRKENDEFNLTTLQGIFTYMQKISIKQGEMDKVYQIRAALDMY